MVKGIEMVPSSMKQGSMLPEKEAVFPGLSRADHKTGKLELESKFPLVIPKRISTALS